MKYTAFLATALLLSAGVASATTYNEIGDAGQTVGTAQIVADGTTSISGTLSYPYDVDLYGFSLDATTSLVIDGLGWAQSGIDSNLILFDGLGHGIEGDDDGGSSTLESRISITLAAGSYLIAFGDNNIGARNSTGGTIIHNDSGYVGLTSDTLAYFDAYGNSTGTYTINFSEAVSAPAVPLPAGFPLLLAGLGAFGFMRRRKA